MTKERNFSILLPSSKHCMKSVIGIKISIFAIKQILFLTEKNKKIVRLGIKKTGCAGLKYYMEIAKKISNSDIYFKSNLITIIVNSKDLLILDGIEIDYITEGVNKNFTFANQKIKKFCGCGNSFDF